MLWAKRVGWVVLFLGGALLVAWAVCMVQAGWSLRRHLMQVQVLVDDPEGWDLGETCSLVEELRGDVVTLQRGAGGLVRLMPALGWLPKVGGTLRAAPHLLVVADGLVEAADLLCCTLEPALQNSGAQGGQSLSLELVLELLAGDKAGLERALLAVDRAREAWVRIDTGDLPPSLVDSVSLLEEGLPLLRGGLEMIPVAPALLGMGEPRNYLILVQNEDELRPAGGYISSAGLLTMQGGRMTEIRFLDAYRVDDFENRPYPDPPEPLFDYMQSEIWLFRDANWSPDFPTSARQAALFFEYGQRIPVDGVIALDQCVVELLMAGLGQVWVPGSAEPVTAANVRQFVRQAWNPGEGGVDREWILRRKEFVSELAEAIRQRVETEPGSVDWVEIAKGISRALESGHLLIFADDPQVAGVLAHLGWDGAIAQTPGDYLMIVDANVGFGKVNPLIDESVDYRVVLNAEGTAGAELSITYAHRGQREVGSCQQSLPYRGDLTYEVMMHRCYYDYLRVYAPAGSLLRSFTSHPIPGEYLISGEPADGKAAALGEEAGKAVIAQFFVVEYGQERTVRFLYDLPQVARRGEEGWHYTLLIQKQPGAADIPVSLTVVLPPGARLVAATPRPTVVDGTIVTFTTVLGADIQIEVVYE